MDKNTHTKEKYSFKKYTHTAKYTNFTLCKKKYFFSFFSFFPLFFLFFYFYFFSVFIFFCV